MTFELRRCPLRFVSLCTANTRCNNPFTSPGTSIWEWRTYRSLHTTQPRITSKRQEGKDTRRTSSRTSRRRSTFDGTYMSQWHKIHPFQMNPEPQVTHMAVENSKNSISNMLPICSGSLLSLSLCLSLLLYLSLSLCLVLSFLCNFILLPLVLFLFLSECLLFCIFIIYLFLILLTNQHHLTGSIVLFLFCSACPFPFSNATELTWYHLPMYCGIKSSSTVGGSSCAPTSPTHNTTSKSSLLIIILSFVLQRH